MRLFFFHRDIHQKTLPRKPECLSNLFSNGEEGITLAIFTIFLLQASMKIKPYNVIVFSG